MIRPRQCGYNAALTAGRLSTPRSSYPGLNWPAVQWPDGLLCAGRLHPSAPLWHLVCEEQSLPQADVDQVAGLREWHAGSPALPPASFEVPQCRRTAERTGSGSVLSAAERSAEGLPLGCPV